MTPFEQREEAISELAELASDVILDFRHHAGDYLADKYHYERDLEEILGRIRG